MAGQELPEFALVMRGYDRQQVDDYVSTLHGYLDEMSARANGYDPSRRSESTAMGSPEAASGDPVALLGDRLMRVLHEAQDAATAIRREAEQDAERVREQAVAASRDAGRLLPSTQAQAEQVLSAARDDADQLLSRAREHAEAQAAALLEEAQDESDRLRSQAGQQAAAAARDGERLVEQLRAEIDELTDRRNQAREALRALRNTLTVDDATSPGPVQDVPTTPGPTEPEPAASATRGTVGRRALSSPPQPRDTEGPPTTPTSSSLRRGSAEPDTIVLPIEVRS